MITSSLEVMLKSLSMYMVVAEILSLAVEIVQISFLVAKYSMNYLKFYLLPVFVFPGSEILPNDI
jgi:hypothetical protein